MLHPIIGIQNKSGSVSIGGENNGIV